MNEEEFLKLVKQHQGILVKIGKMYFEVKQDQEDLLQEILFQLWKSIGSFQNKSSFSTWMYRVALNTALVYTKKRGRDRALKKTLTQSEQVATTDPRIEAFYHGVRQLNKVEKALVFMYLEGLSGEEIAKNLGLSHANVRVKINRTKSKLQEIIKASNYGF